MSHFSLTFISFLGILIFSNMGGSPAAVSEEQVILGEAEEGLENELWRR